MKAVGSNIFVLLLIASLIGCSNAQSYSTDKLLAATATLAEETPIPSATDTPTPEPTATATATATPTPTATAIELPSPTPKLPPKPVVAPRQSGDWFDEIDRGNTERAEVALTFDAGASSAPTPKILDVLRAHGIHSTMFITGQWAEQNPDLLKQIVADGHELGNHSYYHPDFVQLSNQRILEELDSTEALIHQITGVSSKPFFRPPFGSRDARVVRTVGEAGYRTVYWTLDSADWIQGAISANVLRRVVNGVVNGSIVVEHLGSQASADILDEIIKGIENRGFKIVPLSQILTP